MLFHRHLIVLLCIIILGCLSLTSCDTIDLYEKTDAIPGHEWSSDYKPQFSFTIKDTTSAYQLFITLRHNERYGFNNIWLNLYATAPDSTSEKFTIELPLASADKGWLGNGMDDLYDHRIPITLDPQKFNFNKAGNYTFTIEHIMRQDPLLNILNVGLRLEKKAE
jgi:gliding motility-associated lipoprotein GldH